MAYVPQALLPKARNVVNKSLLCAIDNYVIKKILLEGNYDSAYNYFLKTSLEQKFCTDLFFTDKFKAVSNLDEIGFFTRVLLEEYRKLGNQLYASIEESNFQEETLKYFSYLRHFYSREPGEDIQLAFFGDRIKIGIILVAKKQTLESWGITAHLKRVEKYIHNGINRIFLFSYAEIFSDIDSQQYGYTQTTNENRKSFISLAQIENALKEKEQIRLIKKQIYFAKDLRGRKRSAKYYLYEVVR